IVSNRSPKPIDELKSEGIRGVYTVEELVNSLQAPRAVWLMVPAGEVTDQMINILLGLLQPGDALVDGGNSNWKDSKRHAEQCKAKGVDFMDEGTSGGIWGLKIGYCLMIGGEVDTFKRLEPVFKTLAPENGYLHCGSAGSGHFVKMVHNGIEYGMMQSYAEGFEILEKSGFDLDLRAVADVWGKGSVVRSWLLELLLDAFTADPKLESIKGYVEDSGEGRWTIQAAIDEDVPAPIITMSLFQRFMSRQEESFAAKVNAALRKEFGGHAVKYSGGFK
ncbi:MAG TPA: decarboxylating 6-phosphogluconate dehydrogenase, partial [Anaerolineae bacterium]